MVNLSYTKNDIKYNVCLEQPYSENVWIYINNVMCNCINIKLLELKFDYYIGYAIKKYEINKEIFA